MLSDEVTRSWVRTPSTFELTEIMPARGILKGCPFPKDLSNLAGGELLNNDRQRETRNLHEEIMEHVLTRLWQEESYNYRKRSN